MSSSIVLRLVIALVAVVFYGGALWENTWSTVDDGNDMTRTVAFHQRLTTGKVSWLSALDAWNMRESGMCKSCYPWLRWLEYRVFGLEAWKHHLWRFLVVLGLCQLLFSIGTRVTGSDRAGWMTALFYILFSPNVEFWFPLNDAAFYPTILATLSLWVMIRALATPREEVIRRWLLWLFAAALYVPVYYTKENCIALFGVAAALCVGCLVCAGSLLNRHNLALTAANLGVHIGLIAGWFGIRRLVDVRAIAAGTYTADYTFSPNVMLATAVKYSDNLWNGFQLLFPIALALFLWRLCLWGRGRRSLDDFDGWTFVGLSWFGSVVALMLPWKFPIARYLVTGVPGLSLFVGLTLWSFLNETARVPQQARPRLQTVLRWIVLANLAMLPVITLVRNYNYFTFRHDYDRSAFTVVETLAQQAPRGARLFMDMPAGSYSIFNDIARLLALLYDRNDLEQFNYNDPTAPPPRAGDYLLLFVREPTGRSPEQALDAKFHIATMQRNADRLQLTRRIRYERWLLNSWPDAPIFNAVADAGVKLPAFLGMHAEQRRGLLKRERSLVEWTIYQFTR